MNIQFDAILYALLHEEVKKAGVSPSRFPGFVNSAWYRVDVRTYHECQSIFCCPNEGRRLLVSSFAHLLSKWCSLVSSSSFGAIKTKPINRTSGLVSAYTSTKGFSLRHKDPTHTVSKLGYAHLCVEFTEFKPAFSAKRVGMTSRAIRGEVNIWGTTTTNEGTEIGDIR